MTEGEGRPGSPLIRRIAEYCSKEEVDKVPRRTRGIYVLFRAVESGAQYDVVYVGLSKVGVRARLRSHRKSKRKGELWSHFSVFQVSHDVSDEQIAELEGLFRQIYRRDSRANQLNVQRTHAPLRRLRVKDLALWD